MMEQTNSEIAAIADELIDQSKEPWPGKELDRLHYWREKAIHAAAKLKSIPTRDATIQSLRDQNAELERQIAHIKSGGEYICQCGIRKSCNHSGDAGF